MISSRILNASGSKLIHPGAPIKPAKAGFVFGAAVKD